MRFWYLTSTTYGTWLPGDARGSVGRTKTYSDPRTHDNVRGEPLTPSSPGLASASHQSLRSLPVYFSAEQAVVVLTQFLETAAYRGWRIHAVAVMRNHFHLLVEVPDDPEPGRVLGDFKSYASRALNRRFGRRVDWWTDRGSTRPKKSERSRYAAVRYTRDQEFILASHLDAESVYVTRLELYEREHGLLNDP